jgi:hypothetical protein
LISRSGDVRPLSLRLVARQVSSIGLFVMTDIVKPKAV